VFFAVSAGQRVQRAVRTEMRYLIHRRGDRNCGEKNDGGERMESNHDGVDTKGIVQVRADVEDTE